MLLGPEPRGSAAARRAARLAMARNGKQARQSDLDLESAEVEILAGRCDAARRFAGEGGRNSGIQFHVTLHVKCHVTFHVADCRQAPGSQVACNSSTL